MTRLMNPVALSGLLLAFVQLPAFAALTTYTDRSAFDTDAPGLPVEDFEEARVGETDVLPMDSPLDSSSSNAFFHPATSFQT